MKAKSTESPFLKSGARGQTFEFTTLLLLTVVGAGIGLLILYASRVPILVTEAKAWIGQPSSSYNPASSRRSQVIFILVCYTAPLGLGLLVSLMHVGLNWLNQRWRQIDRDDERFKME